MMTAKKPIGRPSKYSEEAANYICERIAEGLTLRKIAAMPDMPSLSTIMLWLDKHSEFSERYVRAREIAADFIFDETVDSVKDALDAAVDNVGVQKAKLILDLGRWRIAKQAPKKYGNPLAETVLDAELKRKELEKRELEIAKLKSDIGLDSQNNIPATEYVLNPDEQTPEKPVI